MNTAQAKETAPAPSDGAALAAMQHGAACARQSQTLRHALSVSRLLSAKRSDAADGGRRAATKRSFHYS